MTYTQDLKEMNEQQLKEYQEMKLNYNRFKEDSYFYKGAMRKVIKSFLKSIPSYILIDILQEMKIIKKNWEFRK